MSSKMEDDLVRYADLVERLEKALKASFVPNATFKTPPSVDSLLKMDMVRATLWSIASKQRFMFKGDSGIGKTSFLKWILDLLGIQMVYLSAPNITVENILIAMPKWSEKLQKRVLSYWFLWKFRGPGEKVAVIDEIGRAQKTVAAMMMELAGPTGTLAGREIEGLLTVVAADNLANGTYGKLASMDLAQASRFATIEVDTTSTPWQMAIASSFPEVDLKDVFVAYSKLDADQKVVFSPAVLENVLHATLAGLPAVTGLTMIASEYVPILNSAGRDTTDEVIAAVCSALGQPVRELRPDTVISAIEWGFREGIRRRDAGVGRTFTTLYIEGAPGTGKTTHIKSVAESEFVKELAGGRDVEVIYLSAPLTTPEDLNFPSPGPEGSDVLEVILHEQYMTPSLKALVVDEVLRGDRRFMQSMMEISGSGSINGVEIPGLFLVIGINNPREVAGHKLDVGRPDLAQARRFEVSLIAQPGSLPVAEYLLATYGEELATPFIEWWQDDIGDLERLLVPPRALEMMIGLYAAGLDISWAKPHLGDEYVPVSLVDLHARLDLRPQARLRAIAAKADEYERLLAELDPEAQTSVFIAFSKAELSQLEAHRDVIVRLLAVLESEHRFNLVQPLSGPKKAFWSAALRDMVNAKSA
jgi:MoxR-like ATPase